MLVVALMGVYLWLAGALPAVVPFGHTLSWEELGASRPLLSLKGEEISRHLPPWVAYALLGLSLLSSIALIATLLETTWRRSPHGHQLGILMMNSLLQLLVIEVLWLYYDRYYLVLLPGLIALLITSIRQTRLTWMVVSIGVLVWAAIAVSGTIDNFRCNRAVTQARDWLLQQHVAPWQIDAGYVRNGWWLYAHPKNLPPGARPESDVPYVTAQLALPYRITNAPVPSYQVIKVFTWQALWAVSDRIYVLQRTDLPVLCCGD